MPYNIHVGHCHLENCLDQACNGLNLRMMVTWYTLQCLCFTFWEGNVSILQSLSSCQGIMAETTCLSWCPVKRVLLSDFFLPESKSCGHFILPKHLTPWWIRNVNKWQNICTETCQRPVSNKNPKRSWTSHRRYMWRPSKSLDKVERKRIVEKKQNRVKGTTSSKTVPMAELIEHGKRRGYACNSKPLP